MAGPEVKITNPADTRVELPENYPPLPFPESGFWDGAYKGQNEIDMSLLEGGKNADVGSPLRFGTDATDWSRMVMQRRDAQIKANLADDPEKLQKWEFSKSFAPYFNTSPEELYGRFDFYAEKMFGPGAIPKSGAKAVLDTGLAMVKLMEQGQIESKIKGWNVLGAMGITLSDSAKKELEERSKVLNDEIAELSIDFIPREWDVKFLKLMAGALPYTGKAMLEGAAAGALAASGLGAIGVSGIAAAKMKSYIVTIHGFIRGTEMIAGMNYRDMVNRGIDEKVADRLALPNAAVQSAIEQFGFTGMASGGIAKELWAKAGENIITRLGVSEIMASIPMTNLMELAGSIVSNAGEEGLQRLSDDVTMMVAQSLTEDGLILEPVLASQMARNIAEDAIGGAIIGGVLDVPHILVNTAAKREKAHAIASVAMMQTKEDFRATTKESGIFDALGVSEDEAIKLSDKFYDRQVALQIEAQATAKEVSRQKAKKGLQPDDRQVGRLVNGSLYYNEEVSVDQDTGAQTVSVLYGDPEEPTNIYGDIQIQKRDGKVVITGGEIEYDHINLAGEMIEQIAARNPGAEVVLDGSVELDSAIAGGYEGFVERNGSNTFGKGELAEVSVEKQRILRQIEAAGVDTRTAPVFFAHARMTAYVSRRSELEVYRQINVEGMDPAKSGDSTTVGFYSEPKGIIALARGLDWEQDVDSARHEMIHFFRAFVSKHNPDHEDLKAMERILGVKDGKWTKADEERLQQMMQDRLASRELSDPKARNFLDQLTRFIRGVYEAFREEISPEARRIMDSWLDSMRFDEAVEGIEYTKAGPMNKRSVHPDIQSEERAFEDARPYIEKASAQTGKDVAYYNGIIKELGAIAEAAAKNWQIFNNQSNPFYVHMLSSVLNNSWMVDPVVVAYLRRAADMDLSQEEEALLAMSQWGTLAIVTPLSSVVEQMDRYPPEAMAAFAAAEKDVGYTNDFGEAGFVVPDGKMLNFSGGQKGSRGLEHAQLDYGSKKRDPSERVYDFINYGAIRVDFESGIVEMGTKPTREQWKTIVDGLTVAGNGFAFVDMRTDDGRIGNIMISVGNRRTLSFPGRFYDGESIKALQQEALMMEGLRSVVEPARDKPVGLLRGTAKEAADEGKETGREKDKGSAVVAGVAEVRRSGISDKEESPGYRKGSDAGDVGSWLLGGRPKAVFSQNVAMKGIFEKSGLPTYDVYELDSATQADIFRDGISEAKKSNKFGAAVYVYDPDDYRNMRLFMSEDGKSGMALKGVDIVSVFSNGQKGSGHVMLQLAIQEGGRTLDCFDTVLPVIYSQHGFVFPVRIKWDESQKPDGWDKEIFKHFNNGEPDVVFGYYDPSRTTIYDGTEGVYVDAVEGEYLYDTATMTRDQLSGSITKKEGLRSVVEKIETYQPSKEELSRYASEAAEWNDWYERHSSLIDEVFGPDAGLFKLLLSATSQATSVAGNVTLATKAYSQYLKGSPFSGYLPSVVKNLERIRMELPLEGRKIAEFGKANSGDTESIAVDRHVAELMFGTIRPNAKQVESGKSMIRDIAIEKGWHYRGVQAALWAYNQIRKGVIPSSYDKYILARKDELAGMRDSGEQILFSVVEKIEYPMSNYDGWVYKSEHIISTRMQGPMPGKNILAMLRGNGVREDELKWTGLDTFLDTDRKLSPAQVKEYLGANKLDIQEVEKWEASGFVQLPAEGSAPSRYSQFKLPGGKNYRELLFTLPELETPNPEESPRRLMAGKEDEEARLLEQVTGINDMIANAHLPGFTGNLEMLRESRDELENRLMALTEEVPDDKKYKRTGRFQSSHWNEQNVLAHTRLDDRTDDRGWKMLFIEEIQSDWHQDGRKKGYNVAYPDTIAELTDQQLRDFIKANDRNSTTEGMTRDEMMDMATNPSDGSWEGMDLTDSDLSDFKEKGYLRGVPDAPFRKTWHEFVFKRILREAAENSYDTVGWTTGEQQAERYDLAEQVDLVTAEYEEGKYRVNVFKDRSSLAEHLLAADELSEYLGKELANKIIDEQQPGVHEGSYSGTDLKVGGEGMKNFYDRDIVNYVNRITKKYGVKTEMSTIVVANEVVHSIEITDAMRDDIASGQSDVNILFSVVEKNDNLDKIKAQRGSTTDASGYRSFDEWMASMYANLDTMSEKDRAWYKARYDHAHSPGYAKRQYDKRGSFIKYLREGQNFFNFVYHIDKALHGNDRYNDEASEQRADRIEAAISRTPELFRLVDAMNKTGARPSKTATSEFMAMAGKHEALYKYLYALVTTDEALAHEALDDLGSIPELVKRDLTGSEEITIADQEEILDALADDELRDKVKDGTVTIKELDEYIKRQGAKQKEEYEAYIKEFSKQARGKMKGATDEERKKGEARLKAYKEKVKALNAVKRMKREMERIAAIIFRPPSSRVGYFHASLIKAIQEALRSGKPILKENLPMSQSFAAMYSEGWNRKLDSFINIINAVTAGGTESIPLEFAKTIAAFMLNLAREGRIALREAELEFSERVKLDRLQVMTEFMSMKHFRKQMAPNSEEDRKRKKSLDRMGLLFDADRPDAWFRKYLGKKATEILFDESVEARSRKLRNYDRRVKPAIELLKNKTLSRSLDKQYVFEGAFGENGDSMTVTGRDLVGMRLYLGNETGFNERQRKAFIYGNLFSAIQKDSDGTLTEEGRARANRMMESQYQEKLDLAMKFVNENMTPEQEALAKVMLVAMNNDGDWFRFAESMIILTNREPKKEPFYFPIVRQGSFEEGEDATIDALKDYGIQAHLDGGMAIERTDMDARNHKQVKYDAVEVFFTAVQKQEHLTEVGPYIKWLRGIFKSGVFSETLRKSIEDSIGRKGLDYIDKQISTLTNPTEFSEKASGAEALNFWRGAVVISNLSWRWSTVLMQVLTSPLPGYSEAPLQMLKASIRGYTNPLGFVEEVEEKSMQLKYRRITPEHGTLQKRKLMGTATGIEKFALAGMKGIDMADRISVAIVWEAVRMKNADAGKSEAEAILAADKFIMQTQPTSEESDRAPMYRDPNAFKQLVLQFTQPLNVIWNNIRNDIPEAARERQYGKIIGFITAYAMSGIAIAAVAALRGIGPDDPDDDKWVRYWIHASTSQFTDAIPFIGQIVTSLTGYAIVGDNNSWLRTDRNMPSLDLLARGAESLLKKDGPDFGKFMVNTAKGVGMMNGVPVRALEEYVGLVRKAYGVEE